MKEMKDSGIPWIGEIPKDWGVKKLKFSCKLFGRIGFRGYTADDLVEESEGAITLSPTNMNSFNLDFSKCSYLSWDKYYESPEIMVEVGDVLLVKTASVGKCSYVDYLPKEATVNPQILVLKEHKDCSKFVAYLFHTSIGEAYIDTTKGGSTIYTISQEKIGNYEFAFPPLAEQQRIAEFLDRKCAEVDEMIGLQEQIIEELKAYKQSVITEAVTKGLNPDAPMRDSGIEWIGQIPEHWRTIRVKYIADVQGRVGFKGYTKEDLVDVGEGAYTIGGKHITTNVLNLDDAEYISWDKYYESPEIMVNRGDIVFAQRGTLGKAAYIDKEIGAATINPSLVLIKNITANAKYLHWYLISSSMLTEIDLLNTSTAVPMISQFQINNICTPNPPLNEQQAIADYLDEKCADIDSLIQTKQEKIDSLKEYKKSIIYEYVTGKMEVV